MSGVSVVWLQFIICAAIIAYAGTKLSHYGDIIADKTGLSGGWIGLALMASVTSLPELVTGVTAVTAANAPNIAVGDVLGSCVFNLAILVVVDLLHRAESVFRRASQGHILSAGFGVIMIGFVGLNLLLGDKTSVLSLRHVGVYTPIILLLYLVAVRTVFVYEREQLRLRAEKEASRYPGVSLGQAVTAYCLAAIAVVGAGIWLPFAGIHLAEAMGWHRTFVGTLFVAGATSLPELVVTVAAVRIGAVDMAIANLLGSNIFNIAILAVDDLLFLPGPLLAHVSPLHGISAISATVMTGMVVVGLLYRPHARMFRAVGWVSMGLICLYLVNSLVLFLHGE